ncbi:hypothetical protein AB6A40_002189 [Gnathostoma spinigerum]|uniref:Uncharacterized protein n=1 Tax=Gnathostoma spinigerum TaxID=75299 RepID=A0ABD6EGN5_9BILA
MSPDKDQVNTSITQFQDQLPGKLDKALNALDDAVAHEQDDIDNYTELVGDNGRQTCSSTILRIVQKSLESTDIDQDVLRLLDVLVKYDEDNANQYNAKDHPKKCLDEYDEFLYDTLNANPNTPVSIKKELLKHIKSQTVREKAQLLLQA